MQEPGQERVEEPGLVLELGLVLEQELAQDQDRVQEPLLVPVPGF